MPTSETNKPGVSNKICCVCSSSIHPTERTRSSALAWDMQVKHRAFLQKWKRSLARLRFPESDVRAGAPADLSGPG